MHGIRYIIAFYVLLSSGCVSSQTVISHGAKSERIHREIVSLNSQIRDDLQVLIFAARERCQNETTRNCLETALKIVGDPDPMEKAYAMSLDDGDLNGICQKSKDAQRRLDRLRSEFAKLQTDSQRTLERASADHFFMAKIRSGSKWLLTFLIILLILKKL